MRVELTLLKEEDGSVFEFRGSAQVIRAGGVGLQAPDEARPVCVSGRFALRPCRIGG